MKSAFGRSVVATHIVWILAASSGAQDVQFDRDVRPILAAHCFACHGPDEKTREADLRLDIAENAAVQAGDADASELVVRIETDDADMVMPPPDSGHTLTSAQKKTLRQWIQQGAAYQAHWAFEPLVRVSTPPDTHPIDALVRSRLDDAGLAPSPPADRYQLLRRVTLDLTGLPPTPEDTDAFVADKSNDAYEKVVDRLLASESFGEHWARMWLDLARYADTRGYEKDRPREIWRYRDWVITALNRDMPFDQFTIEQLAGDLLPGATDDQRLATAFHRNTLTNEEGGTDDEEFRVAAVKDRVDTTMQVWMGLTMGCAKCHSHKYDPISQQEYYRFYALFNQTADNDREAPLMESPTEEQRAAAAEIEQTIASLRGQLKDVDGFEEAYQEWVGKKAADSGQLRPVVDNASRKEFQRIFPATGALLAKLDEANQSLARLKATFARTPVMQELPANRARQTRVHNRGNFLDPGDPVKPGVPAAFGRSSRRCSAKPACRGELDHARRKSLDRSRDGQPHLGQTVWCRHRRNRGRLWHAGPAALPPRVARCLGD